MRTFLFSIFLLTSMTSFSQDYSYFDKWEEKILSNASYFKVIESIENDTFKLYFKKRRTPKSLQDILKSWDSKFKFANPNQKYTSSDVIRNPLLPTRQIIFILKSEKHIFITYRHGGRGRHNHILWAELGSRKVKDIWIGVTTANLDSIDKLKEILKKNPEYLNTNMVCF